MMTVFSPDDVVRMNKWQEAGYFHPFTCKNRSNEDHRGEGVLVATVRGWVCPFCDYTQEWSPAFMFKFEPHGETP